MPQAEANTLTDGEINLQADASSKGYYTGRSGNF